MYEKGIEIGLGDLYKQFTKFTSKDISLGNIS